MTTPIVMTVTDELLAELEETARSWPFHSTERATVYALLAERAELKRDAERLAYLIAESAIVHESSIVQSRGAVRKTMYWLEWPETEEMRRDCFDSAKEAIDAAMQK